jgi:hypothetical protein
MGSKNVFWKYSKTPTPPWIRTTHYWKETGKIKGKIRPKTGREGPEGREKYNTKLPLNSVLDGLGGYRYTLAVYLRKDPGPIVQVVGWLAGPVWTVAEILSPTGIRSLDRLACGKSLYRLSYPDPMNSTQHSYYWEADSC